VMFTSAIWELIGGYSLLMKAKIVFDMLGPQMVKPTTKGDKDETRYMTTSHHLHGYETGS